MTANHLLDAMGLLDDELIQEAEEYKRGKGKNYGTWLAWAASFAVVLVLGYGLTHLNIGMSGGTANGGAAGDSQGASGAPSTSSGGGAVNGATWEGDQSAIEALPNEKPDDVIAPDGDASFDGAVDIFGMEPGQVPAIMVDGTLYWDASTTSVIRPEEEAGVRFSTSYTDGEPFEDGQTNFHPEVVRYMVLENGTVAVNWNWSNEWHILSSERPPEP